MSRVPGLLAAAACLAIAAIVIPGVIPGCHRSSGRSELVVINEVVANVSAPNASIYAVLSAPGVDPLTDANGNAVDWIEIYNPGGAAVNLGGYTLSDNKSSPRKYRFPAGKVIPALGYVVVICDGQPELGQMHASFRLRSGGETVYLFAADGRKLLDSKGYVDIGTDVAVGRYPDGAAPDPVGTEINRHYGVIYRPTPFEPNRPVGIKLPRFQGGPSLTPVDDGVEKMPVSVRILEDLEIVDAKLEMWDRGTCDNPEVANFDEPPYGESTEFTVDDRLGVQEDPRRNFRGEIIPGESKRLILTFQIDALALGTLVDLRVTATNDIGTSVRLDRQVVGGQPSTLVINEYQPRNLNTLIFRVQNAAGIFDPDPRTPDWIEFYNYGEEPIDLTDYSLIGKDKAAELASPDSRPLCPIKENRPDCAFVWRFNSVEDNPVIAPGGFKLILCDSDEPPFKRYFLQGGEPNEVFWSTDFRLDGRGADLVELRDPCGVLVDRLEFDFSALPGGEVAADLSFGRFPDGAGGDSELPELIPDPDCDLGGGKPLVGNDRRIFLTPGCELSCPTPLQPNILECDIPPQFDEVVSVDPRCPSSTESAEVVTYISIDDDTVAEDTPETLRFEVEMTILVTGPGGVQTPLDPEPRNRENGMLEVRLLGPEDEFDLICLDPESVAGARTFRVSTDIDPQPAGTLVTFSYRARDLMFASDPVLGAWVSHDESTATETSFRYLSGFEELDESPPPIAFNEVFPDPGAEPLAAFYPGGEAPPFAELYNFGNEALDLGGMYLSESFTDVNCLAVGPIVRKVKRFRIPEGTVIPARGFVLLLFDSSGTIPVIGDPDLALRTVVVDTIELNSCQGNLFLFAGDSRGHCLLDTFCWNCATGGDPQDRLCSQPRVDGVRFPVGWQPDNDPDYGERRRRRLSSPTPGASNCPYEALVALEDTVTHSAGARDMICVNEGNFVVIKGNALVNAREWLLSESGVIPNTSHGLVVAEIRVTKKDASGTVVDDQLLDLAVSDVLNPGGPIPPPTVCERLLNLTANVPGPQTAVVEYTIRLVDTAGTEVTAGPFSYGLASESPSVAVNEVMARNDTTLQDNTGEFVPWIELYNGTGASFDFGGMFLTDDLREPRKWMVPDIPATEVGEGGFLVIFADGGVGGIPDDLHADLTIQVSGAARLFLLNSIERGHCVADEFRYDFTGVGPDLSIGRLPDGIGDPPVLLPCPTPGRSNATCPGLESDFIRGDANFDGRVNVSDMAWSIYVFFFESPENVLCPDAFDADDNGKREVADGIFIGEYLFLNGPIIQPPFSEAGPDPTPDDLSCFRN